MTRRNRRRVSRGDALLDGAASLLAAPFLAAVSRLSRRRVIGAARALGDLAFRLSRHDRRVALANLELIYGAALSPAERDALARESFRTFFRTVFDAIWFSHQPSARIARWLRFDPTLESAARRLPAIIVTAHFGNWELLGWAGGLHGPRTVTVAAMFPQARLNRLITRQRQRLGLEIAAREGALIALVRALKRGGRVALLMDQNTRLSEGGVFVPFFGRAATMSPAAAALAVRTGAPVIPVFCAAEPDGGYRAYALPAIEPDLPGGEAAINRTIAVAFESEIRKRPGQWLWMYRRWKYLPDGARPSDYPFYAHPPFQPRKERLA